jgi:hypothetical protein
VGDTTGDLPPAPGMDIGLGLLERVAPGVIDDFRPTACAEGCRAIADPVGAGDSISKPSSPRLVPADKASTASSKTAGTV